MFYYIDKIEAIKGNSLILATHSDRLKNFKEVLGENAIEYNGNNLPFYITYDEKTNIIREATEVEKVKRGHLKLEDNQIVINNQIITYDKKYQKIVEDKVVNKSLKELIDENIINFEEAKHQKRRGFRQVLLDKLYADFEYKDKVFQMGEADELNFLRVKSAIDIATTSNDSKAIINAVKFLKVDIPDDFETKIKEIINDKLTLSQAIQSLKINWRLKDNSVHQFTFAEINNVYLMWILRGTSAQEEYTQIASKVMSCKNLDELEAIKWV
jgi:putative uncharacterized protein FNV0174|nr:MAG TPA: protein of unknown function (DUF4376) [Caudoviricetes sp.]